MRKLFSGSWEWGVRFYMENIPLFYSFSTTLFSFYFCNPFYLPHFLLSEQVISDRKADRFLPWLRAEPFRTKLKGTHCSPVSCINNTVSSFESCMSKWILKRSLNREMDSTRNSSSKVRSIILYFAAICDKPQSSAIRICESGI